MRRLGVNIDHVATLRNARGELHPDPVYAAKYVSKAGADSITIHLREDRRHIKDLDAQKICSIKKLLVNLEISTNSEIVKKALKIKPDFICIVPENRKEITTEGGLDLKKNKINIKKIISKFKSKNIRTSLFINPVLSDIEISFSEVNTISIFDAKPATASSIELSNTSETRWWSPLLSVPPIYIPGRFLTGSSPSRTSIDDASYTCFDFVIFTDPQL